ETNKKISNLKCLCLLINGRRVSGISDLNKFLKLMRIEDFDYNNIELNKLFPILKQLSSLIGHKFEVCCDIITEDNDFLLHGYVELICEKSEDCTIVSSSIKYEDYEVFTVK